MARLGVNIDHVATIRQARGESYPSVARAAIQSIEAGAEQITIHLRADRRHIQDFDVTEVKKVTQENNVLLNLEFGLNEEIMDIAIQNKPDWICLVPEKREEKTTEGGLNLKSEKQFFDIQKACKKLKENIPGVKISLFIEADESIVQNVLACNIDAVEIHTGHYAHLYNNQEDYQKEIERFKKFKKAIENSGIGYHAGHGLTLENIKPLIETNLFVEYNIGHWIVGESIFRGLTEVIKDFKKIL